MPLPTSNNPDALITTVGGVHASRIALYVNSIAALQARTAARQGKWWWETRARKFMSSGSNKVVKDGRLVVAPPLVSYLPTRISGSHFAIVHWPSALTKVLPARVARAARSAATSQLTRCAQHVRRRGTVKHRP